MTARPVRNLPASIHRRLLNRARETSRRFDDVLYYYAAERWLYRLSRSQHAGEFILKGALLLRAWDAPVFRPTRDIDLLARTSNDLDSIARIVAEICETVVEEDGLLFHADTVRTERIAEDADYHGVRACFQASLGKARIPMQVDMGFSDIIVPGPVGISYPTTLAQPAPHLASYSRESTIAEKFEAMVKLEELNSRMKDFFDIWALSSGFPFDGGVLAAAVSTTFSRRQTPLVPDPTCLRDTFGRNAIKMAQWSAFAGKLELGDKTTFVEIVRKIRQFLAPIASALAEQRTFALYWAPGGPWQTEA